MKLGTDADLTILEKYRDLMHDVLGTYEENIKDLTTLNQEIKRYQGTISDLNQVEAKNRALTEDEIQEREIATKTVRNLQTAKSELLQTIKEQEKFMRAENKEYKRTNSVVGLLSQTYRKMSKEQRAANQDLAKDINTLRDNLKAADESIGNFQRNVGNYPQMLRQITAVVPGLKNLTGQVNQIATALQGIKTSASAAGASIASTIGVLGTLGTVLGAGAVAYKVFRDSMAQTQTTGDFLNREMRGWSSVYDRFLRMVATADFSNFIQGLIDSNNAGRQLYDTLDEMFEIGNSLSLQEAKNSKIQQKRLETIRDVTKSYAERKKAADEYIAEEERQALARKSMYETEKNGILEYLAVQTGATKEEKEQRKKDLEDFIEKYAQRKDALQKYIQAKEELNNLESLRGTSFYETGKKTAASIEERIKNAKAKLNELIENDDTLPKLAEQYKQYNKLNDEAVTQYVNAATRYYNAEAQGFARTQRARTMSHSLEQKDKNATLKGEKEKQKAINKTAKAREKARKNAEKEAKAREKAEEQAEKARTNATNKINEWTLATQSAQVAMMPSATRQQKIQKDIAQVSAWYEQQTTKLEKEFKAQEAALEKHGEDTSELLAAYINRWDALSEEFDYRMGNAERGGTQDSPLAKLFGVTDEEFEQIKSQALQFAQQLYSELEQLAKDSIQRRLDDELDALDRETESKKAALKKQADDGVISQKTYERRLSEIDKEAAAKQEELKKEAFEKEKRLNIIEATINGAQAVAKTLAKYGWTPAGQIMAAMAALQTAAQVAIISSQKYARGGLLQGASHAQGGIKGSVHGNNIELEGGEVVINKRSSAMFRRELSDINSYNGWGQKFAAGGELPKRFKFAEGGQLPSFAPAPLPAGADTGIAQVADAMNKRYNQLERAIDATNRRIDRIRAIVVYDDIESTGNDIRVAVERTSL